MRLTPEIIAGMQRLALEQRRLLGPRATWHIGDVAWGLRQHEGREPEWTIRLWRDGDRVVAWSWLKRDRDQILEHDVHPDHLHLLDELLDVPDAQQVVAWEDDDATRAVLARHGFTKPGSVTYVNHCEITEAPELPPLPDGYRYRTVRPDEDLAERVATHRDVWEPSRVTESSYRNVMAAWPYRPSLDCVIEAPDGRFASYVLAWPDDENGYGLFEPVGTRADFRRRGLGNAVCAFALRRLYEEGLRHAIVLCVSESACALYESVGFRRVGSLVAYTR